MDSEKSERHEKRMKRKKEIVDAGIERANKERGIIIVHTGNGKGKSSSAFGMVARSLGHNMRVGVIQFIKGAIETGEEAFFRRFPDEVEFHVMGEGYTWDTQNLEQDIKTARKAWAQAVKMLTDESFDLIILDELNIALKQKYLPVEEVIEDLQRRPYMQHVVITGRAAPQALIDAADTVTEMKEIKHAYKAGIKAQKGVEL
ncbi:MAG: cob(I)yrinic acid a,c-diamide adenosyltransferase [Gammaproteobacteria bacterium]|nr:cob(I)yrinic acid a,c-diamide adenosyltransferase [Gammaproteobacteria bacterium]